MSTTEHRPQQRARTASPPPAALLREAQALLQQHRREEAAALYRRILKAEPGNLAALFNLGKICHALGNLDRAAYCFSQALKIKPGEPQFRIALAFVRVDRQDMEGALALWQEIKGKASAPRLLLKLGTHLRILGRLKEAEAFFEDAVAADPGYVQAYHALAQMRRISPEEAHVRKLLEIEKREQSLSPSDRAMLGFTLGNVFLDAEDGDAAFARLARANGLMREKYKGFDISLTERYAENIVTQFSPEFAAKCRGMGSCASDRPVFVTGLPRSGSTLTGQILSAHPQAASLGEITAFGESIPVFPSAEMPGLHPPGTPNITRPLLDAVTPGMLGGIAEKYLAATDAAAGKSPRAVDKMLFNHLWTGMIRLALPKSRVIRCARDPVDTGLSIWRLMFLSDIPWAYSLEDIGRYCRLHERLARHWDALFPGDIHEARYESMVADQEAATRRLLDFCGLPWDEKCLRFHETAGRVGTASATQVRKPLHAGSVGKWRKYERHLAPLLKALEEAP